MWTGENGGFRKRLRRWHWHVPPKKENECFLIRFRWSSVYGRKRCKNASVDEKLFIRFQETENGGFRKRISMDRVLQKTEERIRIMFSRQFYKSAGSFVSCSPLFTCDFHVIDKCNMCSLLDENVRWQKIEIVFPMSSLQIVYSLQYVTI